MTESQPLTFSDMAPDRMAEKERLRTMVRKDSRKVYRWAGYSLFRRVRAMLRYDVAGERVYGVLHLPFPVGKDCPNVGIPSWSYYARAMRSLARSPRRMKAAAHT